ncbi:MAG: DinB family protein [Mucilaginibacter sp.]|nr:DinB family protein [Mucilaginibacter sp.]
MTNNGKVSQLISEVATARNSYISLIENINEPYASVRPAEGQWCMVDTTEHLFWAEQGAIYGMWKILYAIRNGTAERTYESAHKDWSIEKIIAETWKEKEQVPAVAAPRLGGTLAFWKSSLSNLQQVLEAFGNDIQDDELRLQAHPHPISGAMDFHQRLEFLRFHIQRHQGQVESIIGLMA